MESQRVKDGVKVTRNTILGNIFLSVIKILFGLLSSSTAIIADGIHSLSDVISSIGVIIGFVLSSKEADKEHPYGHDRIESLTALFLSVLLFIVAIGIGYEGIKSIAQKNYSVPGNLAIVAAIISIVSKEAMYWYTIKYAKKLNSSSLKADAWHHRSDSFSSIGALIGIIVAKLGFKMGDPLVSIIICILIIKVSYDICKESIIQLIDQSASDEQVEIIANRILSIEGVIRIDELRTRQYGSKLYVDVEIAVDESLTVKEGHEIAKNVHNKIEEDLNIKHCMVHVNPYFIKK